MVPRSKKIIWPKEIKGKARKLRKRGFSYSKISRDLGVAKSTLHPWISDIKRPGYITEADKRAHLNRIRILAARAHREHRLEKIEKIRQKVIKEVAKYSVYNTYYLKSLLAMLYWAEGTKGRGTLAFANTDPKLSLLFLTLLRKSYLIDEEKLRIRLHVHSYHPIKETRKFWSRLLGIPESKFGKIYIKKRSRTRKFRKNFAGICFIKYHNEDLRIEILEQAKAIADRLVPVA